MAIIERKPIKDGGPDPKGKSRWLVRIDVRDSATGTRRQRIVGTFATKTEARKAEREAIVIRDAGTMLDRSKATVGEILDAWLESKAGQVSANSLRDYEGVVRLHLKPALGSISVQELTAGRVQEQYDQWRRDGLSARMVRGCHMRLSEALKQAQRLSIVAANVADAARPPRLERRTVQTWTAGEAMAFLHTAEHRPVLNRSGDTGRREPDDLHPLWHLLLLEGMRRGEGLGLRWRDIDLSRGTASITQVVAPDKSDRGKAVILPRPKTKAGARVVRLTPQTLTALREHRTRQNTRRLAATDWQDFDLIVCTGKGTPINPGNVVRSFDAIIKAAHLTDGTPVRRIRPHDLRHTSATLLLGAGVPAKIVSERLGHATVGITLDLYSHVTSDMQADAAAAMGVVMRRDAVN